MPDHTKTKDFSQEPKQISQSTISRCPHDSENPYSMINRDLIRNPNISFECRMLIILCLSFKDSWEFSIPQLMKHQKTSKDRMYRILNEAMEAGYIHRYESINTHPKNRNLNLTVYKYHVSEFPKFKKCLRDPEIQDSGKQDTKKEVLFLSNIDLKKEDKRSQATAPSLSRNKTKETKSEVFPRVFLTPTQEEHLLRKLDRDKNLLKKCYEKLSDWKIGKGITGGANDYSTFTKWVIDAVKDDSLKSTASANKSSDDKRLSELIWKRCKGRTDIHLGHNYLEFDNGMTVEHLKFGDKDFRLKCLNQLRKRKVSMEGL